MKSNIHKDKRAWWLSHEAFLLLQELAHQQGLQTAAFLEVISREHVVRLSGQANRCIIFTQGLCIGGKGMDIDHWIKVLEILVSVIQALIWPLLALFALLYLGTTLKKYLEYLGKDRSVSEVSAEAGPAGVKFNVKRAVEIATNLTLADKKSRPTESSSDEKAPSEIKTQEVLNIASQAASSETVLKLAGAKVLWVDDNPENNYYERSALEALGIRFTISTFTEDALEKVRYDTYDAIISDMGRQPPDRTTPYEQYAGYTLLKELRERGIRTPFIFYASSDRPEHEALAKSRGAFGSTGNPRKLFQLVIDAIQHGQLPTQM
jgi:CheY-like chemotaxis protein